MKRIIYFLLLCTAIAQAQPVIQQPTPLHACDEGWGATHFNLNPKTAEILGALNPALHLVRYYYSMEDANAAFDAIDPDYYSYFNTVTRNVYARVSEIANPSSFSVATLYLECVPSPTATHPANMVISENPYDGFASFNLTLQTPTLLGGQTDCTVTYYASEIDAHTGLNPVANPTAYTNTSNHQVFFARVTNNTTGCYKAEYFYLDVEQNSMINVAIPDVIFKNKLMALGLDTNFDGNIQTNEVDALETLEIANLGITDLTGIQAFTALVYLDCTSNQLTSLDVSGMPALHTLLCHHNQLTSLNVSSCPALYNLQCNHNSITSLDVSGLNQLFYLHTNNNNLTSLSLVSTPNLDTVNCESNQLTNLTLSNMPHIKYLYASYNALTVLDVSALPSLWVILCRNNQLTSIDVSMIPQLWSLNCSYNQITVLDVTNKPFLTDLYCSNNLLTSLDLTGDTTLFKLECGFNQISSLTLDSDVMQYIDFRSNQITAFDFSTMPELNKIYCQNNLLSAVNLSGLSLVTDFYAQGNQLVELDMHDLTNLNFFDLIENPNLLHINLKNGKTYSWMSYISFPSGGALQYVCADEWNIATFNWFIEFYFAPNTVQVNPYCNFVPGGDYNTITGTVRFDNDNNGCDSSDPTVRNIRLNTSNTATFTSNSGSYNFYVGQGSHTIEPVFENAFFTVIPVAPSVSFMNFGETATQDFCITPVGIHPDVEISIVPIERVRPGFSGTYSIVYKNKGNQTVSGTVSFQFGYTRMQFSNAAPTPDSQSDGLLQFNYNNLSAFESRTIYVTLLGNTPTDAFPLNIGDVIDFNAAISINLTDETPTDNNDVYQHVVQGSYDPNNIICLEGNSIPVTEIGKYLHYVVNFENTGTAEAENIVVKDMIDPNKYDISTLQVVSNSHPVVTRITGNKVEFIFENIDLPPSGENSIGTSGSGIGGHGNVLFKIKSRDNLNAGDMVTTMANIYFDYNFPVATNNEDTVFALLSNHGFAKDNSVRVYPNPATTVVNVKAVSNITSLELFDMQGRVLQTTIESKNTATLDISDRQNGIYFLKIMTEKGADVQKIVKE